MIENLTATIMEMAAWSDPAAFPVGFRDNRQQRCFLAGDQ